MRQGQVQLVFVSLVDSCQVFGEFLYKWNQDQPNKAIRNATSFNDKANLLYQADSNNSDQGYCGDECNNTFGKGKFGLGNISVGVVILVFVGLEDGIVNTLASPHLKKHINHIGCNKEH